jgi:hypothetical protein
MNQAADISHSFSLEKHAVPDLHTGGMPGPKQIDGPIDCFCTVDNPSCGIFFSPVDFE